MNRPKSANPTPPGNPAITVEFCVDSAEGAAIAHTAGGGRIELCAALELGGLTPSVGLIEQAKERFEGPIVLLVRPRPGDFTYSESELRTMERDIDCALRHRLAGIAIGVLNERGAIDVAAMDRLIEHARPLEVTFHRAFDLCSDFAAATDALLALGVSRVLTSGGQGSAEAGIGRLREIVAHVARARARLSVMPGGGVDAKNVGTILASTGAHEVHASAGEWRDGVVPFARLAFRSPSPGESAYRVTSLARAQAIVESTRVSPRSV